MRNQFNYNFLKIKVYLDVNILTNQNYSTVTDLARFLGLSISCPFFRAE